MRTPMHEQAFYKEKEELDDDCLERKPAATSSGGGIHAEIHPHSKVDVKSIETQACHRTAPHGEQDRTYIWLAMPTYLVIT